MNYCNGGKKRGMKREVFAHVRESLSFSECSNKVVLRLLARYCYYGPRWANRAVIIVLPSSSRSIIQTFRSIYTHLRVHTLSTLSFYSSLTHNFSFAWHSFAHLTTYICSYIYFLLNLCAHELSNVSIVLLIFILLFSQWSYLLFALLFIFCIIKNYGLSKNSFDYFSVFSPLVIYFCYSFILFLLMIIFFYFLVL